MPQSFLEVDILVLLFVLKVGHAFSQNSNFALWNKIVGKSFFNHVKNTLCSEGLILANN